ncbi:RAC family serine/threonine-protein kinase homolog [Hyperolius riggenbachi]
MADLFSYGILVFEMFFGRHPFRFRTKEELIKAVCSSKPSFPADADPDLVDLLKRLLCTDPVKRQARVRDLRGHPFFRQINWKEMEAGVTPSPVVVKHLPETPNSIDIDELVPPTDARRCLSEQQQKLFSGFNFVSRRWRDMQKQ